MKNNNKIKLKQLYKTYLMVITVTKCILLSFRNRMLKSIIKVAIKQKRLSDINKQ